MTAPMFWLVLTIGCLVWYSAVTIYVAVKGAGDIRKMLAALAKEKNDRSATGDA